MLSHTIYVIFTAVAIVVCWWTAASAREQPDVVGPDGVFENLVSEMMADENSSNRDVAEMLVAAKSLSANKVMSRQQKKLDKALRAMDEIQRNAAIIYDNTYDCYLDLYPAWRMYILSDDPVQQDRLFEDYEALLDMFEEGQAELLQNLGILVALQKALLPSNVYVDPNNRIAPTVDIAKVLENF